MSCGCIKQEILHLTNYLFICAGCCVAIQYTPMHVLHNLSESELEVGPDDLLQVELADI